MSTDVINTNSRTSDKYFIFFLDNKEYGIEIKYLLEIVPIPMITEIPNMKDYVKGVIDLRGKVIPVFDTRLRLELPEVQYHERTCVVIIKINKLSIGFIVDGVSEVVKILKDQIDVLPKGKKNNHHHCIKSTSRVKDRVIILLDPEKFFEGEHSIDQDKDRSEA